MEEFPKKSKWAKKEEEMVESGHQGLRAGVGSTQEESGPNLWRLWILIIS